MRNVTAQDFQRTVIDASNQRPVLVDFWAAWCGPCRMLTPVLEQLASELADRVEIVKLNTDEEPAIAQTFRIRSIPAVKLFSGGRVVTEFVGVQPAAAIRELIEPFLAPSADDPVGLAESLLAGGDALAATRLLDQLPANKQASDRVRRLYSQAHFVALAQMDAAGAADLGVRVAAARAVVAGNLAQAMRLLLEHMALHGHFARTEGRTDLLRVLEIAGPEHPDSAAARRKLAAFLH